MLPTSLVPSFYKMKLTINQRIEHRKQTNDIRQTRHRTTSVPFDRDPVSSLISDRSKQFGGSIACRALARFYRQLTIDCRVDSRHLSISELSQLTGAEWGRGRLQIINANTIKDGGQHCARAAAGTIVIDLDRCRVIALCPSLCIWRGVCANVCRLRADSSKFWLRESSLSITPCFNRQKWIWYSA